MKEKTYHLKPLILTAVIVLLDQLTKLIIVRTIPLNTIGSSHLDGFFRIIHVRNLGAAFSLGDSFAPVFRIILMIIIPSIVIIGVLVFLIRSREISNFQRWLLAGIAGGGIGNVFFDRIFRPLGVVDFLDFKFYGLFGLDRWPTFNIADMSTVISGVLLMITLVFAGEHISGTTTGEQNAGEPTSGVQNTGEQNVIDTENENREV
ncbi:signal peptidase II [Salinispira pacifica]|uniref:Lipoprotein signal peptidase n=1 Tax=Salinispira pacifica TaxID=1307761 RepID=V5WCT3_9SPIO|nr:signal peptidase II [Salinispira pacifica]AHC13587.1 Lipoprotein signal peptidase [Salinispira pacifica]